MKLRRPRFTAMGRMIQANQAPADGMVNLAAQVDFENLEAAEGESPKPRTFSVVAYTGGLMQLYGWYLPVVVDLSGLKYKAPMTMLINHQNHPNAAAGTATNIQIKGSKLIVAGELFAHGDPEGDLVANKKKSGLNWQASMGAKVIKYARLEPGKSEVVNGKKITGPAIIVQRAVLRETSFVVLGADDETSADIAANQTEQGNHSQESIMKFEQFVKAVMGVSVDEIDDATKAALQARFDAMSENQIQALEASFSDPGTENPGQPSGGSGGTVQADATPGDLNEVMSKMQKQLEAMEQRGLHMQIDAACGKYTDIAAEAKKEGWGLDLVEAKVETRKVQDQLNAEYGQVAIHAGRASDAPPVGEVIEAAMCITGGMKADKDLGYSEPVMNEAVSANFHGYGLHDMMHAVAASMGVYIPRGKIKHDGIRALFDAHRDINAVSGATTLSLSNITANVMHKRMQASYKAVQQVSDMLSGVVPVTDLRAYNVYTLTADGTVQPIGPDGKLKEIHLQDSGRTNKPHTEGAIIKISEDDLINDDMGVFLKVPQIMGRQCGISKEKAWFLALLAIANFFKAANGNYISGATTALSIEGLTAAKKVFGQMKDANDDPIAAFPRYLLTGEGLSTYADQLYNDTHVNETTTADKPKPNSNPHKGKYKPVSSPFMDTTKVNATVKDATASEKHWMLLADPQDIPVMEIAYLHGVKEPKIERGNLDFDELGIAYRCVYRFGVAQADHHGGVYSKGEA